MGGRSGRADPLRWNEGESITVEAREEGESKTVGNEGDVCGRGKSAVAGNGDAVWPSTNLPESGWHSATPTACGNIGGVGTTA